MIFSKKVYWKFRAFDEYSNILDLKNNQLQLVKINMFENLSIFENFLTKNKWHFFEFAAFENRKLHKISQQN